MKTTTTTGAAVTVCMFSAGNEDCACERCVRENARLAAVLAAAVAKPAAEFKGAVLSW